jgi:hypothetical protein
LAPARSAQLLLAEPDPAIAMPLQQLHVRQIANTWHADGGGNRRRHEGEDLFAPEGTLLHRCPHLSLHKG